MASLATVSCVEIVNIFDLGNSSDGLNYNQKWDEFHEKHKEKSIISTVKHNLVEAAVSLANTNVDEDLQYKYLTL